MTQFDNSVYSQGFQMMRPPEEQALTQGQRDHLDRTRWESAARRAKEPELFAQLDRIESMLKQFLAR